MNLNLNIEFGSLPIELFANTPIGEKLQRAVQIINTVQTHYAAFIEKQDEAGMTGIKAITVMTFAILGKISQGKTPSCFADEDWKDIAKTVSEYAVLKTDTEYSIFIFNLYERYIRFSAAYTEGSVLPETTAAVFALADELKANENKLKSGKISEAEYIEACLWISLEAMIKLLASTASLSGSTEIAELTQALASYAFEYGRLMLFSREREIINEYIESQYILDAALEKKYNDYLEDLKARSEEFCMLINNAFADNFRSAFLQSVILAKSAGVSSKDILKSTDEIDDFFLN